MFVPPEELLCLTGASPVLVEVEMMVVDDPSALVVLHRPLRTHLTSKEVGLT